MSAHLWGTTTPTTWQPGPPSTFKRIAVCVDSIQSLPGVVVAIRALAARRSARVLVLHVNATALTAALFPETASRRDVESGAEATAFVEEAVRRLRRYGVDATGEVVPSGWGTAADLLLAAAMAFRADLIVVVPRGLIGLAARIEGGVTDAVLARAWCPVLCLPPGLERVDLRRLHVAYDASPAARAADRLARRLATEFGSQVTRLWVSRAARPSGHDQPLRLTRTEVVEQGNEGVAEALNRRAAAARAGLILIGGHRRGHLAALVLGSVTQRLIAISERPVLVVRGAEQMRGSLPAKLRSHRSR
jgi:nucleotide-binding universal stress UspA family protein